MDRPADRLNAAGIHASVRRAGTHDAPALVRLRSTMLQAIGIPDRGPDAPWRSAAESWFREELERTEDFAAFVVEDPVLGVVSVACGRCDSRPPGPRGLNGVRGQIFNVATEVARRRYGYARACLDALIDWFAQDTPVEIVELIASSDGIGLYESLGFRAREQALMRILLPR